MSDEHDKRQTDLNIAFARQDWRTMTPEPPAKVTATFLPDEPEVMKLFRDGINKPGGGIEKLLAYIDALLQSFNAERLRAEAAEADALPTVGYYLQDKRVFVGNDMMWWAKDGNGYTTDLRKAHVFTDEDYAKGCSRETDVFWPVKYINGLSRPTVDFQYAKLDTAIEQGAQHG